MKRPVDGVIKGKWGKLKGPQKVIDSGHWPMITKPRELVEDMLVLTSSSVSDPLTVPSSEVLDASFSILVSVQTQ